MSAPSTPPPAHPADEPVAGPLLRDPPPPPGYVDPLEGSAALEDPAALATARLDAAKPPVHDSSDPAPSA